MDTNEKETKVWEVEVEDFGSWLNVTDHKESYGKPLELWCRYYCSIILVPMQLIHCHAVYTTIRHDSLTLYLMCHVQHIPLFL